MAAESNPPIVKKILHPGTKEVKFRDGTKVTILAPKNLCIFFSTREMNLKSFACLKVRFHFLTRMCNADKTVLDDTRKMGEGKPFELILGKKFKLEVFEAFVQRMALNEVAEFTVKQDVRAFCYPENIVLKSSF